jgi:hypothetical protein
MATLVAAVRRDGATAVPRRESTPCRTPPLDEIHHGRARSPEVRSRGLDAATSAGVDPVHNVERPDAIPRPSLERALGDLVGS